MKGDRGEGLMNGGRVKGQKNEWMAGKGREERKGAKKKKGKERKREHIYFLN